jgi:hypothetical protein
MLALALVLVLAGLGCGRSIGDATAYREAAATAIDGLHSLAGRATDAQFGAAGAEIQPNLLLLLRGVDNQLAVLRPLKISDADVQAAHEVYLTALTDYRGRLAALADRVVILPVPESKKAIHEAAALHEEAAAAWIAAVGADPP